MIVRIVIMNMLLIDRGLQEYPPKISWAGNCLALWTEFLSRQCLEPTPLTVDMPALYWHNRLLIHVLGNSKIIMKAVENYIIVRGLQYNRSLVSFKWSRRTHDLVIGGVFSRACLVVHVPTYHAYQTLWMCLLVDVLTWCWSSCASCDFLRSFHFIIFWSVSNVILTKSIDQFKSHNTITIHRGSDCLLY